jgi:heat shock protein HslJ
MDVTGRDELVAVEWTLLRFLSDGVESVPGDYPLEIRLAITRAGALSATDGCNWLSGPVEVEADRLVAGKLMRTMRGCEGPVAQVAPLIDLVLHSSPTWVIQDGTLALTLPSADTTLLYEPRRSLFPSDRPGRPAPLVIIEGRRGSADYRFNYAVSRHGVHLEGEWREEPGGAWNYHGLTLEHDWNGPQPNPMACTAASIGGDRVIAGLVTEPTTRVTFRPIGRQDVDLDLRQLPEAPRYLAYIGFVGQPERGSTVHAYDASGAELGPAHAPYWWRPGDPI